MFANWNKEDAEKRINSAEFKNKLKEQKKINDEYRKQIHSSLKPKKERELGNIMKANSELVSNGSKYAVETEMRVKKGIDSKTKRALKKSIEQETKRVLKGVGLMKSMVLSDEDSSSDEERIKRGRGRPKKGYGDLIHIDIDSHNAKDEMDGEGIKKKKRRGRPKKTTVKKVEIVYKMPVQPFSRTHNESLNQLLDARDYYERQNINRNVADMAKYIKDDMEGVKNELKTLKQERDFYKGALGEGIRPKKGSQEAKEWGKKMREAREAKKK